MKFNVYRVKSNRFSQLLLAMKLTVVLLMAGLLQVSAAGFAQKITISRENAPLKQVFTEIQKQTGYHFLYTDEMLQEAGRVDIKLNQASLKEALLQCFSGQPLTYTIKKKTVIVKRQNKLPKGPRQAEVVSQIDTIRGTVTDTTGAPLPGVSVVVKDKAGWGTSTDDNYPTLSLGDQSTLTIGDPQSGAYTWPYALQSYFGRIKYSYKDRYLLQVNYRADGTSRFSKENRWGYFPSVSAAWNISEEDFMPETNIITQLKLRASAGSLGNQSISGNNYESFKWFPYLPLIEFRNAYLYQGNTVVPVTSGSQTNFAVEDIVWETTNSYGLGLDMAFLNDRLIFTGDYYKKTTSDILMDFQIPAYLGFELPKNNVGKIEVKGWEFQLGWRDQIGQLRYAASVNLSDSKSEVIDINDRMDFISGNTISIEGREFSEWYGYETAGLFQTQAEIDNSPKRGNIGAPGDIKFVDQLTEDTNGDGIPDAGDGVINEADRVPLGGSLPRYVFGGNISAAYKGFDFSLVFQGVGKQNDFLDGLQIRPFSEDFGNVQSYIDGSYWRTDNTAEQNLDADYPRLSRSSESNNYIFSDFWRVNGSYLRVKNIILGYTIPQDMASRVKLKGARIYISLRDFFSINSYPTGWDPEVDATSYLITKSFMAGISVTL